MPHRNARMCFWHIPKTGGKWVEKALGRRYACAGLRRIKARVEREDKFLLNFGNHAPPSYVPEEEKRNYFHFCFVRHPLAYYKSLWAYRIKRRRSDKRKVYSDSYHSKDCDEYINNMLDAHPDGYVTELFQLYVGPCADQMDYVGRTETLLADLKEICKRAGQPVQVSFDDLPPRNVGASLPEIAPRVIVSPETAERVNTIEHWVLETFYA